MNILILSAGTRCQLIHYFMQRENGFDKVVTTDCSRYAPAVYMSDVHYIVPRMKEDNYLPVLLKICEKEEIHAVLPLQEDELELIAENRILFEKKGILAVVSDIDTVRTCRDKYLLYKKLIRHEIHSIETYDYETELECIQELKLPVFAKERTGCGSENILKIDSWPLLFYYAKNIQGKLVVQPYLRADEYGVDVYVDVISGEIISIFAKEKIRMRAGETEKSKSIKDDKLFTLVQNVVRIMNFKGPVDMDIFKYEGNYYILEINPRFGGGYPHAYECGVNFIKYLSQNVRREKNSSVIGQYKENEVLLKYTDVLMKNEKDMF